MSFLRKMADNLSFRKQCRDYNVRLWQCPQFLFLVMGLVIIAAIIGTNIVAQKYVEPGFVALIVLGVTAVLFIISYTIVSSFEVVALSSMAKSDFISIMSHRLRTPITKIKWQLNILLSQKIKLNKEETDELFLEIQAQNERMIKIINNLLDLNFIEDNKFILTPSLFSLRRVIDEVVELQSSDAKNANVVFEIVEKEDLPDVFADRVKVKDMVYHLVDNAIRYSTKGGKITIILEAPPLGKTIRCEIVDEGAGIPFREEKKIFTKFFRSHGVIRYQTEGTGIGLFLAKTIVEKSGGEIGFNTIEGKGSSFWFILPAGEE